MKVEVDDLGSPSLIVRKVSVDVKQHLKISNSDRTLFDSDLPVLYTVDENQTYSCALSYYLCPINTCTVYVICW